MKNLLTRFIVALGLMILPMVWVATPADAYLQGAAGAPALLVPGDAPDYLTSPNWAYSPLIRKFVDPLPGICDPRTDPQMCERGDTTLDTSVKNIPVAVPDIVTYPGSDYYEIELVEFQEKMHTDLPPTTMRGYRQVGFATDTTACVDPVLVAAGDPGPACTVADNTLDFTLSKAHFLGPVIVAQKDRPVRVKFINMLGTGPDGDLFIPVDETLMGSGEYEIDYDPITKEPLSPPKLGKFTQNRGELHLHGGRTPWISDGTPHQWITPAGDNPDYPQGASVVNVSDMPIPARDSGIQTYYWTNQQSARLMFYHDHAWGITRLNVYIGEAAGYVIEDQTEQDLITAGILPTEQIPLVVMDKTYVDATPVANPYGGADVPAIQLTDPTWRWGTGAVSGTITEFGDTVPVKTPNTGDLWWPHVYMPAQNPFDPTGIAPMGRWAYGPYFWPPTNNPYQPVANPYYNPDCNANDPLQNETDTFGYTTIGTAAFCQPPEVPSTPNPSWGAEAFMDTPTVNGTAYPVMTIEPKSYRLRILNASHDRFFNLQMYLADPAVDASLAACGPFAAGACEPLTEVKMVPATTQTGYPDTWPTDGRNGGVPDYTTSGPNWIMYASEGGFLPRPVVIPQQPVDWNVDVTTFNAGNVNAGSLMLGPAERADVIVDFSAYAGQTLILYNDAPAPWPAIDPHYDYYTGAPDQTDIGGAPSTLAGLGPNTRTVMKIVVAGTPAAPFDLAALNAAFNPTVGNSVFQNGQDPLIVAQGNLNPTGDPAYYEAFVHGDRTATVATTIDPANHAIDYSSDYGAIGEVYQASNYPLNYPNWGISRISDKSINFMGVNGDTTYLYNAADNTTHPLDNTVDLNGGVPLMFKAIQDEQGETFDDYGRMRAGLGLEINNPGAGVVNFMIQTYSDPATEILEENGIQVWKITHNGVDTHPVHFHLYDVQVLNRVGWDGFMRLPDPTELGWKDTVRISPLEDTIVALKPVTPRVPFGVPESYRPLNPARPIGDNTELTQIDPYTGAARSNLNRLLYLDWEYVWHCHILSHEENDMMRPQSFLFQEAFAAAPVLTDPVSVVSDTQVNLSWTDPTPIDYLDTTLTNYGAPDGEIGFRVERALFGTGNFTVVGTTIANTTTFSDTTVVPTERYEYRVVAYNAAGDSALSNVATISTQPLFGVIVDAGYGGTVTPPGPVELYSAGANASFSIAPDASFSLIDVFVDGASIGATTTTVDFNAISADHSLSAWFAPLTNAEFVDQLYLDTLNRAADAGGLAYWTGLLDSNTLTRAQVANAFLASPEFIDWVAPISRLYFVAFNRIPDYDGLMFQVDAFKSGLTLEQIAGNFAASPEFVGMYGGMTNTELVTALYQNALNRIPSADELAFYVNMLDNSLMTVGQVVLAFSSSPEFVSIATHMVFVTSANDGLLRTVPAQTEFDFWVAALDGGASPLLYLDTLLSSATYAARFGL